ncbi:MAG: redoxin domain-containing protein [Polyangiaceae bacterium]|nr:redoxin domain-containing protein [Polyangiaceae bacterium]
MRRTWLPHITKLVLLASVALVSILALELQASRRESRAWADRANSLVPGSLAPIAEVQTLDGQFVELGRPQARAQLYLVYRTDCVYCTRSLPAWLEIVARAETMPAVRILGISLDSEEITESFEIDRGLTFSSVSLRDTRLVDLHRFWIVPQTIVLNSQGRVAFSRIGVIESAPAVDSVLTVLVGLMKGEVPTIDLGVTNDGARDSPM